MASMNFFTIKHGETIIETCPAESQLLTCMLKDLKTRQTGNFFERGLTNSVASSICIGDQITTILNIEMNPRVTRR